MVSVRLPRKALESFIIIAFIQSGCINYDVAFCENSHQMRNVIDAIEEYADSVADGGPTDTAALEAHMWGAASKDFRDDVQLTFCKRIAHDMMEAQESTEWGEYQEHAPIKDLFQRPTAWTDRGWMRKFKRQCGRNKVNFFPTGTSKMRKSTFPERFFSHGLKQIRKLKDQLVTTEDVCVAGYARQENENGKIELVEDPCASTKEKTVHLEGYDEAVELLDQFKKLKSRLVRRTGPARSFHGRYVYGIRDLDSKDASEILSLIEDIKFNGVTAYSGAMCPMDKQFTELFPARDGAVAGDPTVTNRTEKHDIPVLERTRGIRRRPVRSSGDRAI